MKNLKLKSLIFFSLIVFQFVFLASDGRALFETWGCYDAEEFGVYPTIQDLARGQAENVGMYEFLLDMKRSPEDVVDYIVDANITFVFRGNLHFGKEQSTPEFYAALKEMVNNLKAAKPGIIVQGGVECGTVHESDLDPYTGEPLTEEQINAMLLRDPETGEPLKTPLGVYFIDTKYEETRDFIVGRAQHQIDSGVDSLFFDLPYYAARRLGIPESTYDPYWLDIVSRVRNYAIDKGKTVSITANNQFNILGLVDPDYEPYIYPGVDIATIGFAINPETNELVTDPSLYGGIDYPTAVRMIYAKLGNVPIHSFMDYAWHLKHMPLTVFGSAPLDDQKRLLQEMDTLARSNGILPVYPLHICWAVVPKELCFIATAAYGSQLNYKLDTFREFRDKVLMTNPIGTGFVELYYTYGETPARIIEGNHILKFLARTYILDPLYFLIKFILSA